MPKTFYILDGTAYIYRAFYAIRELSNARGLPTNAVYGFTKMLQKIVEEKKPDYIAIAFDAKGPTFRHALYDGYKADRPPMPDALSPQLPYIDKIVDAFRIPTFREPGLEADDLIGTLAKKGTAAGLEVVIASGDKDMYQLIGAQVSVYDPMKEKVFTTETIEEQFGIKPDQIVEMMGLMGDSSDQIPGVAGVGKKTAMQLIHTFGSIENLLSHLKEVKKPKLREKLEASKEIARLSLELVTIRTDCDIPFALDCFISRSPDVEKLRPLCEELGFSTLLKTLIPPPGKPKQRRQIGRIVDAAGFSALISGITEGQAITLRPFTTGEGAMDTQLRGIALATHTGKAIYLPLQKGEGLPASLKTLLSSGRSPVYGHGLKILLTILKRQGIVCRAQLYDTEIAHYLLNPTRRGHSLEAAVLEYLPEDLNEGIHAQQAQGNLFAESPASMEIVSPEVVSPRLCREAALILPLSEVLSEMLASQSLNTLFRDVEMPLVSVLSDIEQCGVKIDLQALKAMSTTLAEKLASITARIYELAGREFNINSPKQLADILFVHLGLTPIKKTKTGYSTNEEVLKKLSLHHPLPEEILNSRQITKLKSTYIDALPKLVHPETGRVHTQLNQTITATGRLSSSDPNLQNIPVRGEMGRHIRETFIADEGYYILSADYNQIELRILAHLSEDPQLIAAFQSGEDVHTQTAVELFGLSKDEITQEMRRAAKTVNFGIIYGISPFGLSNNLGVSMKEAKRYIDLYFEHFRGVKHFFEKTLITAGKTGYVTTLFDRRRFIPELASMNSFTRGIGERLAMNTPVQGSAADIIKLAMIKVASWMTDSKLKSKMTLQVHDELLFEVPEEELTIMKENVTRLMEEAANLKVPLIVDVGVGANWSEAH